MRAIRIHLIEGHRRTDVLSVMLTMRPPRPGQDQAAARHLRSHAFIRYKLRDGILANIESVDTGARGHPVPCLREGQPGVAELEALWPFVDRRMINVGTKDLLRRVIMVS